MKNFILLFIITLTSFCKTQAVILQEPKNSNTGLVVVGLAFYNPSAFSLLDDDVKYFKMPDLHQTIFTNSNSNLYQINYKNNTLVSDSSEKAIYSNENLGITNGKFMYFIFSDEAGSKDNFFLNTGYTETLIFHNPNGTRTYRYIPVNVEVDRNSSKKELSYQILPNKITFIGNFLIQMDSNKSEAGIESVLSKKLNNAALKSWLYDGADESAKAAEITFLKKFIKTQGSGKWVDIANVQLNTLNSK